MENQIKIRIRWSDFNRYEPIRIIISDWKNLTIVKYGKDKYMLVDCIMEHGKHKFELLVPYYKFVRHLRGLEQEAQKLIVQNKAIITIMKTYKDDNWGMCIRKVETYIN